MATIISISTQIKESIAIDATPDSIENHFVKIKPKLSADERKLARDKELNILDHLRRTHNSMHESGEFCHFTFNSSSPQLIQGCCHIEKNDPPSAAAQKTNCMLWNYYANIIDSLTPREFEQLSKKVLSILGGSDILCTRQSADEGIDFIGKLHLSQLLIPELPFKGIYAQSSIWIIGQSKQYKSTSISTPVIRELIGSVMLLKYGITSSDSNPFVGVTIRPLDPVFHLIIVTGHITRNTKTLLKRSGVGYMDREMVSSQLATSEVGRIGGAVDIDAFRIWLNA